MDERLAQLTLNMLKQLNLRVPQDIRLASLYDNENLVNTVPPISAVQFNADILGLKATQQLLCALQGQPVETRMELGYHHPITDYRKIQEANKEKNYQYQ